VTWADVGNPSARINLALTMGGTALRGRRALTEK
jgi:hypothetical protein